MAVEPLKLVLELERNRTPSISPKHHPFTPTMVLWFLSLPHPRCCHHHRPPPLHHFPIWHLNSHILPSSFPRSTATPPFVRFRVPCSNKTALSDSPMPPLDTVDCVGTGQDVECLVNTKKTKLEPLSSSSSIPCLAEALWEWTVLVLPFFF